MSTIVEIPIDDDFAMPRGGQAAGYSIEWTPPGLDREKRTVMIDEIGPADDRLAISQAQCPSALSMLRSNGPLGALAVWWIGGRHEGRRESYIELEPMFTFALLNAGDVRLCLLVRVPDTPDELDELDDQGDDELGPDPT